MKYYAYTIIFLGFLLSPLVTFGAITPTLSSGDTVISVSCAYGNPGGIVIYDDSSGTKINEAYCPWNNISFAGFPATSDNYYIIYEVTSLSSCSSQSACETASTDLVELWTETSTFSLTDPDPPVYGCTDPDANNYDPEATEDDDSCTYDEGGSLPDFIPIYGIPFEQYIYASSTCIQTNEGTSTPNTYSCTATSTTLDQPTFNDWLLGLSVIIWLLSFVTWGYFFSPFKP